MASEILPTDILYEIFSQLPIKSLFRFRCVSSVCRSVIDDPYFAYMHQTRSVEEPNVLVFHHPWDRTDVMFKRDGKFSKHNLLSVSELETLKEYQLECSCHGLSCFTKVGDNSHVILFNPLRQQVVCLRPTPVEFPQEGNTKYGLGFDCSENAYKIVRVVDDDESSSRTTFYTEVLTLGTSSWRAMPKGPSCRLYRAPVYACGNLYWLGHPEEDLLHEGRIGFTKIVSFDISKEEFGLIYLPNRFRWCHLLDLNGNLAINVDRFKIGLHIDIWVLIKQYERKDQWVQKYKFEILNPPIIDFFFKRYVEVVGVLEFGQELILRFCGQLYYCDPKSGTLRQVYNPKYFPRYTSVQCHLGSLLSISKFHAK